jgi:DNA polymerase-1
MARKSVVAHNAQFDLSFLAGMGFEPGLVRDTMLMSQLLYTGRRMAHKLADCVQRELGRDLAKDLQKSDWSGELRSDQLGYAAADADVLLPLCRALDAKLASAKLISAVEVEHRCLPAVVWLARSGVALDVEAWRSLAGPAEAEVRRLADELNAAAPAPEQWSCPTGSAWNWDSPAQVKKAFAAAGVDLPDTRDGTLAKVNHPLARLMRAYRDAAKRKTTYGKDWLKHVDEDGRVYAGWRQLGCASGRMSCSCPNLQQLPRRAYRRCVYAPPGRVLVKADYSQIELRIAAKIAGDKAMVDAYRHGLDLHTLTAQRMLGREQVTKEDRQVAKSANFGLLFGMGAPGYRAYAKANYGVDLTEDEARRLRDAFFRAYPGLVAWHRRVRDQHARETRTLTGRRRLLEAAAFDTIRLNSPVQGSGADGLKKALALLWERRAEVPEAFPVLAVHDEIVVECDRAQAEAVEAWLRRAMVDGMAPLIDPVPCEVEVKVGVTWGE